MLLNNITHWLNKRKWIYILLIVLTFAIIILLKNTFFRNSSSHDDSFKNGLPKLQGNEKVIINHISKLHQNNKKEEAYTLLNEMNDMALNQENALAQYYVNSLKCFIFSQEQQYDQSVNHGKKALEIVEGNLDSINLSNTYQNICASYFQSEQLDSGEKYTKLGFEHALEKGDSVMLKTFSMNLGTIAFNKNLLGLAGYYFMKSASIKTNGFANTDTLLYANIISILISNKDYQEAERIWSTHKLDNALDGNSYVNQHLQCNRIALYQVQKQWEKSRKILTNLHINDYSPDFKAALFTNKWHQIHHDEGIRACADYFKDNKTFFEDYFNEIIPSIIETLTIDEIQQIDIFKVPYITSLIDKHKIIESNDKLLKYSAHMLLGLIYQNENKPELANENYLAAYDNHNEYLAVNDSLRVSDIDHQIKFERLLSEQNALSMKLTTKTKENQILILLGSISTLFLITLIILIFLNGQKKQAELQLLTLEKIQTEEKDKHLEKEKQLNNRIVELSKSIIIKSNELGNTISSSTTNSAKELYKIKRELAKISHFENIEHPEIADKLYQNNELYEKLFPSLTDFNKTEKRIFALSIEDYKVKDISALMGLSSQYVHNVRSRLKKKVGFEDNVTWSELKKRAMEETLPTTS